MGDFLAPDDRNSWKVPNKCALNCAGLEKNPFGPVRAQKSLVISAFVYKDTHQSGSRANELVSPVSRPNKPDSPVLPYILRSVRFGYE